LLNIIIIMIKSLGINLSKSRWIEKLLQNFVQKCLGKFEVLLMLSLGLPYSRIGMYKFSKNLETISKC